ncbi:MAG TPA: tetratricopeptide repeat protein [Verrucomicrobiae bacterium]|nr:tetratricopeptide repeat protein [Verrucomicrobiae bacterium]
MKRLVALVGIVFASLLPSARAQQSPDDQYVVIYSLIQQADSLQAGGQAREALTDYTQALTALRNFQRMFPHWNEVIVGYRLNYLTGKVKDLAAQFPATTNNAAPATTPPVSAAPAATPPATNAVSTPEATAAEMQINTLRSRIQALQADNGLLQDKLREALQVQPATVDTQELARAQAQALSLMKENDLLRASLAAATNGGASVEMSQLRQALTDANQKLAEQAGRADKLAQEVQTLQSNATVNALERTALAERLKKQAPPAAAPSVDLSEEVKTLRARLAVDEAAVVPFTPEELALMKPPAPALAAQSGTQPKPAGQMPARSAALAADARNYFSAGDYEKAGAAYLQILKQDPKNAVALANLATIELQENKLADAEKHITAALAQNPDDAYALATFGNLKFRQKQYDQALDALSRAAKLDPTNPEIQNYLGVTLSEKGLRSQAETALRKAVELNPNYTAAQNNLAVIYLSAKPPMPALARWHYQKALDLGQPRNPDLEKKLAELGAPVSQ